MLSWQSLVVQRRKHLGGDREGDREGGGTYQGRDLCSIREGSLKGEKETQEEREILTSLSL